MQLTQLERTIELLRQKLTADTESLNEMQQFDRYAHVCNSLALKIQETIYQIGKLNKEYERRLNQGMEHFSRFKANRAVMKKSF